MVCGVMTQWYCGVAVVVVVDAVVVVVDAVVVVVDAVPLHAEVVAILFCEKFQPLTLLA